MSSALSLAVKKDKKKKKKKLTSKQRAFVILFCYPFYLNFANFDEDY